MKPAQTAQVDARMKPGQWTAILVLALMVGGISFVSVYLGDFRRDNSDETVTVAPTTLVFPFKTFPREDEKVQTTEVRQVGHQDYWFVNDSQQDVKVGLNGKGCTCTEVELTVAPPEWMEYLARSAVTQALQQPPRGLDNVTTLAAANERSHQFPELPDAEGTMLTKEYYATVPAGAVGRVRLTWKQEQVKPLRTYAELWLGQRDGNATARLEAGVRISSPVEVSREFTLEPISERELEKLQSEPERTGRRGRGWIVCYSLTRPTFHLKAELLHHEPHAAQSDPVEVGTPIPLEEEVLRRLEEKSEGMHRLTALSGYRIPVTVWARAKDGTPIEWGRFHRIVQLTSPDPGFEPVQIQVTGEVVGDISIGSGDEGGTINLGPFPGSHGTSRAINLETDEKGLDLELEKTRNPKFLKVTLSEPQDGPGHRAWVLRVTVPPNAAHGEFPRPDNPDYRDSAIYVKTKGGKTGTSLRSIRIPVRGVANEG
jgi:hypothetical protein